MTTALSDASRGLVGCFAVLMLVAGYICAPLGGLAVLYFVLTRAGFLGDLFFVIALYYVFLPGVFCILCGHLLLRWSAPPNTTADNNARNSDVLRSPTALAHVHDRLAKDGVTRSEIVEGRAKPHDSAS
jgi:hypothetical protein